MKYERFASVWDALEDSPAEAANMKARSKILIALRTTITGWNVTRDEAAERLSVTTPRVDEIIEGQIDRLELDALLALATAAGLRIDLHITSDAA